MSRAHICILGCGSVARLHSRVARTLRSRIALSYASRSRDKAEQYRRRFRGVAAFGSYEEACADAAVDAVFICTPHAFHVEHATLAARHRKAMLIEKPVSRTLEELAEIERVVRDAGVVAMVAENYYFKPLVSVIRSHVARGDVGEVQFVELNRAGRSRVSGWRADAELMGGGALLEGGVHWVNLLASLGGEPVAVVAARPQVTFPQAAPHEDGLELLVKFADGAVGKLLHSWNVINRVGGLGMSRILGTHGNIHFESNGLFVVVLGRRTRVRVPGVLDLMGYRGMLAHFADCVTAAAAPRMSLAVARRDMALVKAAYRSLESGAFEPVGAGASDADPH